MLLKNTSHSFSVIYICIEKWNNSKCRFMLADKHVLKIMKISQSLLMLEDNLKGKINMFD